MIYSVLSLIISNDGSIYFETYQSMEYRLEFPYTENLQNIEGNLNHCWNLKGYYYDFDINRRWQDVNSLVLPKSNTNGWLFSLRFFEKSIQDFFPGDIICVDKLVWWSEFHLFF